MQIAGTEYELLIISVNVKQFETRPKVIAGLQSQEVNTSFSVYKKVL
jgi:hypothetical protein